MTKIKQIIAFEVAFFVFAVLVAPINAWVHKTGYGEAVLNVFFNVNLLVATGFLLYWLFSWAFDN